MNTLLTLGVVPKSKPKTNLWLNHCVLVGLPTRNNGSLRVALPVKAATSLARFAGRRTTAVGSDPRCSSSSPRTSSSEPDLTNQPPHGHQNDEPDHGHSELRDAKLPIRHFCEWIEASALPLIARYLAQETAVRTAWPM
jgi:hypothetical protein